MLKYHPYKSDKPEKKYYIITNSGRKIYFGAAGMSDFTKHKDEARKQRYINRHKKNENWGKSGIDTAGYLHQSNHGLYILTYQNQYLNRM